VTTAGPPERGACDIPKEPLPSWPGCDCGKLRLDPVGVPLIGVSDLAGWLGTSPRHVRRLVEERRVPYLKIGHYVRFDPVDIATWIDRQKVTIGSEESGLDTPRWVRLSLEAPRAERRERMPTNARAQTQADEAAPPPWIHNRRRRER